MISKVNSRKFAGILLHLHPASVKKEAIEFRRTFGLGGMAALLVIIQLITGIMLRFYYEPFPHRAYDSILNLQNQVLFGRLTRNVHHWSGVFLVIIAFLHMLRVFFTGGCYLKRKVNWVIGLVLLFLIILLNFTGYLLPWDQLAFWAVTVGSSLFDYLPLAGSSIKTFILGGDEVNAATLIIFYNFHTAVLPFMLLVLTAYHFWKVRKSGGIILPDSDSIEYVPTYPSLVYRELVTALTVIAIIFVFSVFLDAPLLGKADPDISPNPVKAPWYFAGIQELLVHFHPLMAAFIIPSALLVFLFFIPFLNRSELSNGEWFYSETGRLAARYTAVVSTVITIVLIITAEYISAGALLPGINSFVSNGIIPLAGFLIILYSYYILIKRKFALSYPEVLQTMFVFIISSFIVLTIVGICFRGADMRLTLPWNY